MLQACAAARPALLVLDDLHWADRATLLLLRHLGRMLEPVPLLVLGTYRDTEVDAGHPLAAALGDLRRDHPLVTVSLGGLADDEVADLVRAADGAAAEAGALAARTRGNPLFVEELRARPAGRAATAGRCPSAWRTWWAAASTASATTPRRCS